MNVGFFIFIKKIEFNTFAVDTQRNAETARWKKRIGSVTGAYQVQGIAEHGADEIVHTIRVEVYKND